MVGRCCWVVSAVLVVPLAIVIAVFLETPEVITLDVSATPPIDNEREEAKTETSVSSEGIPVQSGKGSGGMFDRIAFVYDSTNKWMSLGLDQKWRTALVKDCLSLEARDRVLDLATGTADVSILVGAQLQELSAGQSEPVVDAVLGLDPSKEMLRRGVVKVEDRGLKGLVRLVNGDAQDMSSVRGIDSEGTLSDTVDGVASASVDKISMSFGIRNVPNRSKALKEMRRVLRRSEKSRVCILEFSLPSGSSFLSRTARAFITHVIPFIGKVATLGRGSEEYEYLEKSILQFPQPLEFAASMAREGLPVHAITSFAYGAVHLYSAAPAR